MSETFPIDNPSYAQAMSGLDTTFDALAHKQHLLQHMLATLESVDAPQFFHTLGFAASGKTTLLTQLKQQGLLPENAFYLSFDALMENLPSYRSDLKKLGVQTAFQIWEPVARALGYDLLQAAIARRYSVVFEHSGARDDHVDLLRFVKQHHSYCVTMLETHCSPDKAWERAILRERYLPRDYITGRAEKIAQLRPAYLALADVFETYDTETLPIKRIASSVTAKEEIAA